MWKIDYHPEAKQDLIKLDGSQRKIEGVEVVNIFLDNI